MSTKSFLRNINIDNENTATELIEALESATIKENKNVQYNEFIEEVVESEKIKEIFTPDGF